MLLEKVERIGERGDIAIVTDEYYALGKSVSAGDGMMMRRTRCTREIKYLHLMDVFFVPN